MENVECKCSLPAGWWSEATATGWLKALCGAFEYTDEYKQNMPLGLIEWYKEVKKKDDASKKAAKLRLELRKDRDELDRLKRKAWELSEVIVMKAAELSKLEPAPPIY